MAKHNGKSMSKKQRKIYMLRKRRREIESSRTKIFFLATLVLGALTGFLGNLVANYLWETAANNIISGAVALVAFFLFMVMVILYMVKLEKKILPKP